jgi:polynucleotide 5'-triphosphatase
MANGRIPSQQPVTPAQPPPRKRVRYTEPPIWAQSILAHKRGANGVPRAGHNVNGKQPGRPVISQAVNGHPEAAPVQINPAAVLEDPDAVARELLADWEPTITGNHVTQSLTKTVGDFFFEHVVNRPDAGELASRNVEIEIEAKLGQLLHADTKDKFDLPVMNEVVLSDRARTTFQSSMTEVHFPPPAITLHNPY